MTTLAYWDDLRTDHRIFQVSGFAEARLNWEAVERGARERFPILWPTRELARTRYLDEWLRENIAPLVWLSFLDHEPASGGKERPNAS